MYIIAFYDVAPLVIYNNTTNTNDDNNANSNNDNNNNLDGMGINPKKKTTDSIWLRFT